MLWVGKFYNTNMLLIDNDIFECCPRCGGGIGGLIDAEQELLVAHLDGRAWHVGPLHAITTGAGEELVAAPLKLQYWVEVVALGVRELRTALWR